MISRIFPRTVDVADVEPKQSHLSEQFGQRLLAENFATALQNLLAGIGRDEIAQSALVVDDALASQMLVGFHGGVRIHFEHHGIFAHARNAVVGLVGSGENLIAEAVGHLDVYCFVVVESHCLTRSYKEFRSYKELQGVAFPFGQRPLVQELQEFRFIE